jgi:hypothetical protein
LIYVGGTVLHLVGRAVPDLFIAHVFDFGKGEIQGVRGSGVKGEILNEHKWDT